MEIKYRGELYLPYVGYLPNKVRNHFIAAVGEFVGTFLFLFFAFAATQVANAAHSGAQQNKDAEDKHSIADIPDTASLLYIALAFGFSLAVNAWVFFRISGGLFNPAVTLGLVLIGALKPMRAVLIFVAQLLGAMASAALVYVLFPGDLQVATTLGGETSIVQGLFIEAFLTAELVFTIIMLAAEKHKGTFLAPIGIGLSLFIAEMTGVYFTGGSLNPARTFGPCVVLHSFPGYHWIYWLGPAMGSAMAAGFYHLINILEYETANPGQDFNEKEMEHFVFDEENAHTGADVARPDPVQEVLAEALSPEASGDLLRGRSPNGLPSTSPKGLLDRIASASARKSVSPSPPSESAKDATVDTAPLSNVKID
ncbi:Putative Aquaporin [[Torrubiella] hemipterigena]|uniref:Putative Aquaporin n=1 Tax=[Torrubiella] hemipterigena TaxID=1531966 RepID=A0A0A1TD13_9HYPO|nr:Putative Aquaporin [[Torrubiella] hemipterigena]